MSFSHCCMVEYAWQKHQHASPSPFKFNKYINIETESKFSSVTRTITLKSVQLKDNLHLLIHLELILSTLFFFFSFSDNQQSPGGHVTFRENMCLALALALAHAFMWMWVVIERLGFDSRIERARRGWGSSNLYSNLAAHYSMALELRLAVFSA